MNPRPAFGDYWSLRYSAGGTFVTRHASQYLGAVCAWSAQQAGLSPSQVTLLGTATFLAAAAGFVLLPDTAGSAVLCALLFQLGYGLDCADGQLARAQSRTSTFGAWLDMACDYVRNIVLAAAIATWLAARGVSGPAVMAAILFASGTAVHLHTVSSLRRGATAAATQRSIAREVATGLLDTATVLLLVGLLRPFPFLLCAATALIGAAYLALSVLLARARLF